MIIKDNEKFVLRNKEMYKKKAAQCLLDGKRNEPRECFQRCLEVTQKMAHDVIKVKNFHYIEALKCILTFLGST